MAVGCQVLRNGDAVTPRSYQLINSRLMQRERIEQLLQQATVSARLEEDRVRRTNVQRKLEEIEKIALVQRIRVGNILTLIHTDTYTHTYTYTYTHAYTHAHTHKHTTQTHTHTHTHINNEIR